MSAGPLPQTSLVEAVGREPAPPVWVQSFLGTTLIRHGWRAAPGIQIHMARGAAYALITARIARARTLSAADLRQKTAEAYAQIGATLRDSSGSGPGYPVRFWNHVPGLLDEMGLGLNRYMAFNAGRFAAFTTWYGDIEAFDHRVATASGIGHAGDELVIHCLASRTPGIAIANPRQTPPHRYSRRYGPLPPCFARATLLKGTRHLLVGGTASVVGEDSLHIGDLDAQVRETLTNLAAIASATDTIDVDVSAALARYTSLRVYHPVPDQQSRIAELLYSAFPTIAEIEWVCADLCRDELLVEIEGLASIQS